MIRYLLVTAVDDMGRPISYIQSYLPPSADCPLPMVSITIYKAKAQVFTEEEINAIPNSIGTPMAIHV